MIQCRMGVVEKASEKETPPAVGQARKRQPVTPPESERELQQTEERQPQICQDHNRNYYVRLSVVNRCSEWCRFKTGLHLFQRKHYEA